MDTLYAQPPTAGERPPVPLRLAPINGLRGLAILGVIYFHVIAGLWSAAEVPVWVSPLTNGWTGVNLFFILSGVVLFLPYAAGKRTMGTLDDRLGFYRRRALRLLPLFYLAVLVQWPVAALRGTSGPSELLSVLSFRFILDPRYFGPSFNPQLWSIGVEVAFSAVFPLLVLAGRRLGTARLVAAVLAVALGMRLLGYLRDPYAQGFITFNTDMFVCRLDEFVLGMMLAQLYVARRLRGARLCLPAGLFLVLVAWVGFDLTVRHVLPTLVRAGLNDVLDAGLCLIVASALAPSGRVGAALSWRPLQVLGMMCYSLYIWHWPLLHWLMPDRTRLPAPELAAGIAVFLGVTLVIAGLSYRFVEFGRERDWRRLFLLPGSAPGAMVPADSRANHVAP